MVCQVEVGSEPTRVSELSGRLSAANEKQPSLGMAWAFAVEQDMGSHAIRKARSHRAPKLQLGRVFKS